MTIPTPRLSASVLLVRDGPSGLELFMVRRADRSHAMPSVYVFPGGTVRADDYLHDPDHEPALASLIDRSDLPLDRPTALAIFRAAVRELFEEGGVLLARGPDGQLVRTDGVGAAWPTRLTELRDGLQRGQLSLDEALRQANAQPDLGQLTPFSHWITPEAPRPRFDAWFFVAPMPPGQEALHCQVETSEGAWITPPRALAEAAAGRFAIIYPTETHLRRVAPFGSVADLLAFASSKPIRSVLPSLRVIGETGVATIRPDLEDAW